MIINSKRGPLLYTKKKKKKKRTRYLIDILHRQCWYTTAPITQTAEHHALVEKDSTWKSKTFFERISGGKDRDTAYLHIARISLPASLLRQPCCTGSFSEAFNAQRWGFDHSIAGYALVASPGEETVAFRDNLGPFGKCAAHVLARNKWVAYCRLRGWFTGTLPGFRAGVGVL